MRRGEGGGVGVVPAQNKQASCRLVCIPMTDRDSETNKYLCHTNLEHERQN